MRITIDHLFEHPELVESLAQLFQEQWGQEDPLMTTELRVQELARRKSKKRLPMTLIALDKNRFLGTYSLDLRNMETHPELAPWLANIYVKKELRNEGIGTLLIKDALKRARKLKLPELHLYASEHRASWYEELGWKRIGETTYHRNHVVIMEMKLNDTQ